MRWFDKAVIVFVFSKLIDSYNFEVKTRKMHEIADLISAKNDP